MLVITFSKNKKKTWNLSKSSENIVVYINKVGI